MKKEEVLAHRAREQGQTEGRGYEIGKEARGAYPEGRQQQRGAYAWCVFACTRACVRRIQVGRYKREADLQAFVTQITPELQVGVVHRRKVQIFPIAFMLFPLHDLEVNVELLVRMSMES